MFKAAITANKKILAGGDKNKKKYIMSVHETDQYYPDVHQAQ